MKTLILTAMLALTAVSGVVVAAQPAAAMNPGRQNEGASRPAPIAAMPRPAHPPRETLPNRLQQSATGSERPNF